MQTSEAAEEVNGNVNTQAPADNNKNNSDNNDTDSRETRWKDGDELEMVRVRFPGNSRSFPFLIGKRKFQYGQKVVAMSDRGIDIGYINSFPYMTTFKKNMLPIRSINKVASEDEILKKQENAAKEREAENFCKDLIEELKLKMTITHVEFLQFGKKIVFYFNSPARVDFRELVKRLVGKLKSRIELRQISVRDRAAAVGSIGACGLATCCSTFLKNYGGVNIKMAKNQSLALIPSKINGVCGQLKCCVKYEDDVYTNKRKVLPREGTLIQAKNGDKGKITKLRVLQEEFEMITEKGKIRRYAASEYDEKTSILKNWTFPRDLPHVVNETAELVGSHASSDDQEDDEIKAEVKAEKKPELEAKANESKEPSVESKDQTTKEVETKPQSKNNQNRKKRNRNNRSRKPRDAQATQNNKPVTNKENKDS